MDLERADTFTVYRDMGDIVNPVVPSATSPMNNKFILFQYGARRHTNTANNNNENQNSIINAQQQEEDGIMDEETWNWSALIARVFAFFLLFLIIICIGLEAITRKFLVLAAIICVLLVIVIVGTYIDLREKCCWCLCPRNRKDSGNPIENPTSSSNISNPLISSTTSKIQIVNRHVNSTR
jgi:hypothetical protein